MRFCISKHEQIIIFHCLIGQVASWIMFKRYHQDIPFLDVILVVEHVLKGKKKDFSSRIIIYSTIMLKLWLVGNQSTSLDEAVGPLSGP